MSRRRCRRRGSTMVEVFTVVAIIGVMVGLFLPAIRGSREAARRVQCSNNLKQLALALANHVSTHERLPSGVADTSGPILNIPRGYQFSWTTQLLPFMEQRRVYDTIDFTTSLYSPSNARIRTQWLSSLICPSDPAAGRAAGGIVESNYAGCHNDVEAPIHETNTGVLFLNSRIRYDDIPDGTSNTIFLGEKLWNGHDLGWASGTRATLRNTGTPINAGDLLYAKAPIPTWAADGSPRGGPPVVPDPKAPELVGGFESGHPGGAHFAFGDGSVRFLAETIRREVFRCLGHRADGEMIDARID